MAKIKICGIFRVEDAAYVNEAGPDYIGLVFAPSRRRVNPGQAARLRSRLAPGIVVVGVFVNAPAGGLNALYRDGLFDMAQLHGDEDGDYIRRLRELSAGTGRGLVPVIKALRVESAADLEPWRGPSAGPGALNAGEAEPKAAGPEEAGTPDYLLLDRGGGTGRAFDWDLLGPAARGARAFRRPWFLAGGISGDTIGRALSYRPFAVDVSSGAETGGLKDREKIIALVKQTREELNR